jgi:O-antigen ligase
LNLIAMAAVVLLPLSIAPGLFFYFDITPKVAELYLLAAVALVAVALRPEPVACFVGSRRGRWFTALVAGAAAVTLASAVASTERELAWTGSTWRHFDAITQVAVFLLALLAAAAVTDTRRLLTAVCIAGIAGSLYEIAQYFGVDPLLPSDGYRFGEGVYQIVRPPGTLGHSGFFTAWLLWPVLAGLQLRSLIGLVAAFTGSAAIVLGGSRGAVLGLVAGLAVAAFQARLRTRTVVLTALGSILLLAAFYVAPAGAALRARARWIREDALGGARLLLWRDSLKMALDRPLAGFGPDAFVAEFPRYQSAELARAHPNFYHESPHNIFLDALTGSGIGGLLILAGLTALGLTSNGPMRACLAAVVVAHQFIVFDVTNLFMFILGAGLAAREAPEEERPPPLRLPRRALATACAIAAVLAAATGVYAAKADRAILAASNSSSPPPRSGLQLSRMFSALAEQSADPNARRAYAALAQRAAVAATQWPEQRSNAWYNLALFSAAANDVFGTEAGLRAAIRGAPSWFKPHWTLARLLAAEGRSREAASEAELALYLNGGKDAEVTTTMNTLLRSARQ